MKISVETRILFGVVILCPWMSLAHAEERGAFPAAAVACGADDVEFDVKTDKSQHPTLQPEAGKAVVYVIEDIPQQVSFHITQRVGLDGAWVGANRERSYFAFSVDPGLHHLCASVHLGGFAAGPSTISLRRLTAETGRVYYFRVATYDRGFFPDLQPVDEDEGQYLVETSAHSTSHPKQK
ncbi:MAG: hypothetical protein ABSH32_08540 [Bryobacteraceae bacterium]|jgi:hypothetical protein